MLEIGDRLYPSRYPLGYPLVLLPAAVGGLPAHRLWLCTGVISLLGVAALYLTAVKLSSPLAATWSALMLGMSPLYLYWGVRVMSDVPATALVASWTLFLFDGPSFVLLGIVSGFAFAVRLMELPLLLVGGATALAHGRRATIRFAVGAGLGLAPTVGLYLLAGLKPDVGYNLWHARSTAGAFEWRAFWQDIGIYSETIFGAAHPKFYSYVALPAIGVGVLAGLRSNQWQKVVSCIAVAILHLAIAVFYFFRAPRLLLPILPLVLTHGAVGIDFVYRRRPVLAALLGSVALLVQLRSAIKVEGTPPFAMRVGPTLVGVSQVLPRNALIVSDVSPPLAWLYWLRGTDRAFMPLARLPHDVEVVGDLGDTYVRRLDQLADQGFATAPSRFVENGRVSDAGRLALEQRGRPVAFVLCTGHARRAFGPIIRRVAAVRSLAGGSPCELMLAG